jgi:hypothetical protein
MKNHLYFVWDILFEDFLGFFEEIFKKNFPNKVQMIFHFSKKEIQKIKNPQTKS